MTDRKGLIVGLIIAGVFVVSFSVRSCIIDPRPAGPAAGESARVSVSTPPSRIVSMAPNLTEILFTLGLGDRVVGVTRFCEYPAEAANRAKVGGHLDPNFEAVLALRPDLVVLLREQTDLVGSFAKLGIPTLLVSDNSLEEVHEAIKRIGRACDVEPRAERVLGTMKRQVARIQAATANRGRPRVLLVIDRTQNTGQIEDAFVAGSDPLFNDLIRLAGGRNAYRGPPIPFPVLSTEGLLRIDPEVIVDFSARVATDEQAGQGAAEQLHDWEGMQQLAAVRENRVYMLGGRGMLLPGPRTVRLLKALAERIHPEANFEGTAAPRDY